MTSLSRLDEASRRIIACLARRGPLPRTDLAGGSGLSSGSVTRLTRPLLVHGYLRELAPRTAMVGRPSVPLEVVPSAGSFIGVKVVPGSVFVVRTGLTGEITERCERAIDTTSAHSTAVEISGIVAGMRDDSRVDAVGVGLAAAVAHDGTIRAAALLGWAGGNLQEEISTATGIPCISVNDVDAFATGEHWFGDGRDSESFVVLTIGSGVGAGLVLGGDALRTSEGAGGMLGAAWLPDGRTFHDVLHDGGICRRVGAILGREVTYAEALTDTSPEVSAELDDAVTALGRLVGLATLAYGPDRVMLSGEGIPLVRGRTATLMRAVSSGRFYDVDLPEVIIKECTHFAWARGAAVIAMQHTLLSTRPTVAPEAGT